MMPKAAILCLSMAILSLFFFAQPSHAQPGRGPGSGNPIGFGAPRCPTDPPPPGRLSVNILPQEAVAAGAQWRVDSGPWQNSNAVVDGLTHGLHRLEYKNITGWVKPGGVIPGAPSMGTVITTPLGTMSVGAPVDHFEVPVICGQTAVAGNQYLQLGTITVTIEPQEAITAGAQWRVEDGFWATSGYTKEFVASPDRRFSVEFKELPGWVKPANQVVNVEGPRNITLRRAYRLDATTAIRVNIQPAGAVRPGTQWRFVGRDLAKGSGLVPGQYELEFDDIGADWDKPSNQTVTIAAGQTVSVTGTYTPATGLLNVTIEPKEANQADAKWRVGIRPWRRSGESERVPAGQQIIEISTPPGWRVVSGPGPINVVKGQVTSAKVTLRK